jgi:predicted DNA-binding transcriptional regulator AlpA
LAGPVFHDTKENDQTNNIFLMCVYTKIRKQCKQGNSMSTEKQTIQLVTAKEAGKICNLSKRSWFRLCSCGKVPAPIRIGGSVRWRQDIIESWIMMGCPSRREFEARQQEQDN